MTKYLSKGSILLWCVSGLFLTQISLLAYDLSEIDGDDISGNAPVLLGWPESELPVKWATVENNGPGTPVTPAEFTEIVENSFAAWENVPTSFVRFEKANDYGASDGVVPLSPPVTSDSFSPVRTLFGRLGPPVDDGMNNLVYCVTNGWTDDYGFSTSALAVTLFAFSTNTRLVAGGDIFLNCDDMAGIWDIIDPANPDQSKYDIQNTITHEIGHLIGLGHPYADGRQSSTMFYSAATGETSKRELSQDDINGINYLYPEPGVLLIPPDTNRDGLKDLSNPDQSGGCSIALTSNRFIDNKSTSGKIFPLAGLLSYGLLLAFFWKIWRRSRALTIC
jgi:hypothetical protein